MQYEKSAIKQEINYTIHATKRMTTGNAPKQTLRLNLKTNFS